MFVPGLRRGHNEPPDPAGGSGCYRITAGRALEGLEDAMPECEGCERMDCAERGCVASVEPPERTRVTWKVPELTGDQVHERTYVSKAEAERQAADIRGFEGVTDVKLEPASAIA